MTTIMKKRMLLRTDDNVIRRASLEFSCVIINGNVVGSGVGVTDAVIV